jgi:hypothetical protein
VGGGRPSGSQAIVNLPFPLTLESLGGSVRSGCGVIFDLAGGELSEACARTADGLCHGICRAVGAKTRYAVWVREAWVTL